MKSKFTLLHGLPHAWRYGVGRLLCVVRKGTWGQTPETGEAEATDGLVPPAWRSKRQQRRTVRGAFWSCLLGGRSACPGFVGRVHEAGEILRRFGSKGITQYAASLWWSGEDHHDTQMTLFTAEG